MKKDSTADEILRAVHVLSSFLGTRVHVRHVRRVSTDMSDLADDLTRRCTPRNMFYDACLKNAKFVPPNYEILSMLMSNDGTPLYNKMLWKIKKMIS